jgi:hypothetical protein
LAALAEGADVTMHEKSKFPRHKVCGEFLSPEIVPLLSNLGIWSAIAELDPPRYRRLGLYFRCDSERRPLRKSVTFSDRPYGLSRYRLDHLMLEHAQGSGGKLLREADPPINGSARIIAHGRKPAGPAAARATGRRFGFKAHFDGPSEDAIELYFFRGGYIGVNAIEGGRTNVCGLATEPLLSRYGFDIDGLVSELGPLRDRLEPLRRQMDWLHVGPLVYGYKWDEPESESSAYLAGDALSFVDPFTGTGIVSAVLTGSLAGRNAARGVSPSTHLEECRGALGGAYRASSLFRAVLGTEWAAPLAKVIPGRMLVALTRPSLRSKIAGNLRERATI